MQGKGEWKIVNRERITINYLTSNHTVIPA